jgi:quercetin dioxygenase-like cupin family protein
MTSGALRPCLLGTVTAVLWTVGAIASCNHAFAQAPQSGPCKPVSQRTGEIGCWIVAAVPLAQLPRDAVFWHLDTYPTRTAAEAAKGPGGTVVEGLGKIWLFTIAGAGWRPSGGVRVAEIGPLPVRSDTKYTAQYLESIVTPGVTAPSHRHPGPEAWYTQSGEACFETPEGKAVARAGGAYLILPGERPMHFTVTGSETRRAFGLVLHDSTKPAGTPAPDWTPKGLCKS